MPGKQYTDRKYNIQYNWILGNSSNQHGST